MLKKIIEKLKFGSCNTKMIDSTNASKELEKKKLENGKVENEV